MKSTLLALALTLTCLTTHAQHSDVWLLLEANTIAISPQNVETTSETLIDQTTGLFLFTGDFGDLGQGQFGTDDPGYQTQANTFTPNVILAYQGSGQLWFWDGSQWTTDLADSESLNYIDALGTTTSWDDMGVSNAQGYIDQVGGDGSIHSHLNFAIDNTGGTGNPTIGAYMVELSFLTLNSIGGTVTHELSEPIRIAFNNQLSAANFDQAIAALTTATCDIDMTSGISLGDLLLLERHLTGQLLLSQSQENTCDLNNDSRIDLKDLLILQKNMISAQS